MISLALPHLNVANSLKFSLVGFLAIKRRLMASQKWLKFQLPSYLLHGRNYSFVKPVQYFCSLSVFPALKKWLFFFMLHKVSIQAVRLFVYSILELIHSFWF